MRANIGSSRRPPLRFLVACLACGGLGNSGGSRQRGRVGAAEPGSLGKQSADFERFNQRTQSVKETDRQVETLRLFNEKVAELLELSFVQAVMAPDAGISLSGKRW